MTKDTFVPFNRPSFAGDELQNIAEAVARGHISGNGSFTLEAEELLARISGSPVSFLTTSCTHALELAARILRLGPGDEVIVPAYTFVSTASAFALTGAKPVFVDVDPLTLCLDPDLVLEAITDRTRAVCTVHYAGVGSRVDELQAICESKEVTLIEDNAHGLGAKFKGQYLGTFGQLSTLSFHETKNITCGEGGALNINDESFIVLAEILREKGTDRSRFLRGQVDKYTWVEVGSSWVMSDLLAAVLVAQLNAFTDIQASRTDAWNSYDLALGPWADEQGIRTPFIPLDSQHSAHMYYLQFEGLHTRDRFISHLRNENISAVFHYQALNTSLVGESFGGRLGQCPVSERASETIVRLPLYASLSSSEQERVIQATLNFET